MGPCFRCYRASPPLVSCFCVKVRRVGRERQQESRQSKLLEEEIEVIDRAHRVYVMSAILSYAEPEALIHPWATQDFSGTPFVTFVAWITHRGRVEPCIEHPDLHRLVDAQPGLARAPMCCAAAFDWWQRVS